MLGGIGETCSGKAPLGVRKLLRGAIEQRITKDQRRWCSVLSSTGESWVMSLPSPSTVELPDVTCGSWLLGFASLDDGPLLRVGTGGASTYPPRIEKPRI